MTDTVLPNVRLLTIYENFYFTIELYNNHSCAYEYDVIKVIRLNIEPNFDTANYLLISKIFFNKFILHLEGT